MDSKLLANLVDGLAAAQSLQGDLGFVLRRVEFAFLGLTHDFGFPGFEDILNFCLKSGVHFSVPLFGSRAYLG